MPNVPLTLTAFSDELQTASNAILGDASAPYALISVNGRYIGAIAIDVPIREVHNDSFIVTQNPVRSGVTIADHCFRAPPKLEMLCGFSDSTAGYSGYVQLVYQAFLSLAETRTPFDVSTGKRLYSSMLIESIDVSTDEYSEFVLFITVRLQKIIITDTNGAAVTADNQQFPQTTGPTLDMGVVSLLPAVNVPSFAQYIKSFGG